jgi:hypothetical protein
MRAFARVWAFVASRDEGYAGGGVVVVVEGCGCGRSLTGVWRGSGAGVWREERMSA